MMIFVLNLFYRILDQNCYDILKKNCLSIKCSSKLFLRDSVYIHLFFRLKESICILMLRGLYLDLLYCVTIRPKKTFSDLQLTLLNYVLLKSFFRGLRDFRKNSTETCFLVILHLISMFFI